VLHFAGRDIAELKAAFANTIADYRDWRRERGSSRKSPIPGRFRCAFRRRGRLEPTGS
jgi:hypothetical protein